MGNLTGPGTYPLKYLDAFFDSVVIRSVGDDWIPVRRGDSVHVEKNAPVRARVTIINLGEAALLCAKDAASKAGGVCITVCGAADRKVPLPKTLQRFEQVVVEIMLSEEALTVAAGVEIGMVAENRAAFGPRYKLQLVP